MSCDHEELFTGVVQSIICTNGMEIQYPNGRPFPLTITACPECDTIRITPITDDTSG